jgi:bifunctional non-homologous end joining protein LigD
MQVYVPLNSGTGYETTRAFALAIARVLERETPGEVVSNMRKDLRKGRVFIDWSQNHEHKTTVGVYSLRARERPTVSAPVTWDEVNEVAANGDGSRLSFEAPDVLGRVEHHGDLFAPLVRLHQTLPLGGSE